MHAAGPLQRILAENSRRVSGRRYVHPDKEFFILFTARTGSSHLSELLTNAGVGDVREWLHPQSVKSQAANLGARTFDEYFVRMRSRCPNGVFGQKMTIWFYEAFAAEVRLENYFDFDARCVFLFRENVVEQAVSLCLAEHRKVFHDTGATAADALPKMTYNAMEILQAVEALLREEDRLKAFVGRRAKPARYLSYESFTSTDPAAVVGAIAEYVGVAPNLKAVKSRHRKLGDEHNADMARRFFEDNPPYRRLIDKRREWLFKAARKHPLLKT